MSDKKNVLHVSNNEDMLPLTGTEFDRAFKVRPLTTYFNRSFQNEPQAMMNI